MSTSKRLHLVGEALLLSMFVMVSMFLPYSHVAHASVTAEHEQMSHDMSCEGGVCDAQNGVQQSCVQHCLSQADQVKDSNTAVSVVPALFILPGSISVSASGLERMNSFKLNEYSFSDKIYRLLKTQKRE